MAFDLCIIADDFTGAGDSAIQFRRNGFNAFLGIEGWEAGTDLESCNVLVVSTESRFMDGDESYRAVREAVRKCREFGARYFFKKIDSTLRGNIADEVAGMMDEAGYSCAVVAPSAPRNHRTVVSGHCLIDGHSVGSSGRNADVFTPVKDSFVPALFESRFPGEVGHIELSRIRKGPEDFLQGMQDLLGKGCRVIVADAESIDDLRIIASVKDDDSILFVGASGLAEAMTGGEAGTSRLEDVRGVNPGELLFLVGSVTETSKRQVEYLKDQSKTACITVAIPGLLEDRGWELKRLSLMLEQVPADYAILIETRNDPGEMAKTLTIARENGLDEKELGRVVSGFLGKLVTEVFKVRDIRALFVTGGDTAARTAEALGLKGIELLTEVLPGIPLGRFLTSYSDKPVYLVSKAGGFGTDTTLVEIFEYLTTGKSS